ncbi:MAG: MlaD family protein [Parachlamydiales bacterium]|jgi:phospholipid/cholesterol/gamma-HCH transport system substrate-binding protein
MAERSKTLLIGLFVAIAMASSIYLIMFLKPAIGDGKKLLKVRFSNIANINVGTRVTVSGKPVGEVAAIEAVESARSGATDELGRVYFYLLTLKVDSRVEIYNTDEIVIATTGLLGEKSIAIIPKAPIKDQVPKIITEQIIFANSVEPLEKVIHEISSLAERLQGAVDDVDAWFVENEEELSFAVRSFGDAFNQINLLAESANKEQLASSLKTAMDAFTANMDYLKEMLKEAKDKAMMAKFDNILDNFKKITTTIADGEGTIGKLIQSDDFYLRISAVMNKVDTLMNDINHYGLMFQYDRHWQRIRTKKMNLLNSLSTPAEFKGYFENEADNINTSLGRLTVLMEKAEKAQDKEPLQKNFRDLMRKVEHLLDALKLYNQDQMDLENQEQATGQS